MIRDMMDEIDDILLSISKDDENEEGNHSKN